MNDSIMINACEALIEIVNGTDLDAIMLSRDGPSVLHEAIGNGRTYFVKALISIPGINLDSYVYAGDMYDALTPLQHAEQEYEKYLSFGSDLRYSEYIKKSKDIFDMIKTITETSKTYEPY